MICFLIDKVELVSHYYIMAFNVCNCPVVWDFYFNLQHTWLSLLGMFLSLLSYVKGRIEWQNKFKKNKGRQIRRTGTNSHTRKMPRLNIIFYIYYTLSEGSISHVTEHNDRLEIHTKIYWLHWYKITVQKSVHYKRLPTKTILVLSRN